MSIGEEHAFGVTAIGELVVDLVGTGVGVRCQQPIALPPRYEPEPDGAIVRGSKADYLGRHPRPADVLCVIEVADSSLEEDRTVKLRAYAEAGIAPFLIVNIPDRQIEWHDGPQPDGTYAAVHVVRPGETMDLPIGDGRTLTVPAERFLPPAAIQP
jgi:Uma2 family endonuclease